MLFNTMLSLSKDPDEVAKAYDVGIEIWEDIYETEYKKINDEETKRYFEINNTNLDLNIVISSRLEKVLDAKLSEFQKKVGLSLFEDVFPTVGFFRFYINDGETDDLIRAFRKSNFKFSIQNKAEKVWEYVSRHNCYGYNDQGMINLISETITTLCQEPFQVAKSYLAGKTIWEEIHSVYKKIVDDEKRLGKTSVNYETSICQKLAKTLSVQETKLKIQCGYDLYSEVIAVLSILYFDDAQNGLNGENGEHASRIVKAFKLSDCSDSVKDKVEEVYKIARLPY